MDIQLSIGDRRLHIPMCSLAELSQARFASLTFTNQKNRVHGEVIGLAHSGDPCLPFSLNHFNAWALL